MVTNWHVFALQDDTRKRGVVNRGVESDSTFCDRRLEDLDQFRTANNLFVINDEAHHAYRFYPEDAQRAKQQALVGEKVESD